MLVCICGDVQNLCNMLCLHVTVPFSYAGAVENSVILVGSASDTEGYVMIYGSEWKFLAAQPSHWTDTHAQVVCRQLGYEGGVVPSNTNGYRWVTTVHNMQCTCIPIVAYPAPAYNTYVRSMLMCHYIYFRLFHTFDNGM